MTHRWTHAAIAVSAYLAIGLIHGLSARAADAPSCNREALGQASCFSPKLCTCIYDRGGAITGTPAGYRWDCGTLRPNCGEGTGRPATMNEFNGPYPLAIGIDRDNRNAGGRYGTGPGRTSQPR